LGRDPGLRNIPNWEFMEIGDYVMCVYGATYQYVSRLLAKHDNEDFAKAVWGRDERGRTWQLMYFLTEPVEVAGASPISGITSNQRGTGVSPGSRMSE
jgi:hypothetical protein